MNSSYYIPLSILFLILVNLALIFSDSNNLESTNSVDFEFSVMMEGSDIMDNHKMHMVHHFVESGIENPAIQVREGDTVTISFKNTDSMMIHDFVIPELGIHTNLLEPGEFEKIQFEATKSGRFDYYCSIHSEQMSGLIIITM